MLARLNALPWPVIVVWPRLLAALGLAVIAGVVDETLQPESVSLWRRTTGGEGWTG